jgi:GT2 family glycosyltransferase/glycosyltransferase involved in cell wall biosynthesis
VTTSQHTPEVTAILHAYAWPEAPALDSLRARLREALPDIEIIEAREDPTAVVGAATLINHAAARAAGRVLLVLEPSVLLPAEHLRALIDAARDGLAVEVPRDGAASDKAAPAAEAVPSHAERDGLALDAAATNEARGGAVHDGRAVQRRRDAAASDETAQGGAASLVAGGLLAALDALLQRERDRGADSDALPVRQPVWAIARARFEALGGLDERFWSVGLVEDLRARAYVGGVAVRDVALEAQWIGPVAYPLLDPIARLLRLRNPVLTAFKTQAPDALGERLAEAVARAISRAWEATGLSETTFQFGGSWGRRDAAWRRLARGAAGRARLPVALRDPDGCLLPLLAIDSALEHAIGVMPALSGERARNANEDDFLSAALPETDSAAFGAAGGADLLPQEVAGDRDAEGVADVAPADAIAHDAVAHDAVAAYAAAHDGEPLVSVIIVNWNGVQHLRDCFKSLFSSDYPADRLDMICVDNGSTDGSRELLRAEFPHVKVVALESNRGFTGGNEAGVAAARGDVFVFLNNDMRVEPDCLRELVRAIDGSSACVGARVLSWDGRAIDFIRGSLNFEARGFQDFYGVPNLPELSTPTDTFFPNGGAFAVTRAAYTRAGGFDPAFFAYYDDVDLGWRLRLTGSGIRVAGRAVVYHRHGATSRTQPKGQKRFLMERNALWTLMKNYGDRALRRTLGVVLALAVRRLLDETDLDRHAPLARALAPFVARCRPRGASTWSAATVYGPASNAAAKGALRAMPLESLGAMAAALAGLPRVARDRAAAQAARRVPDADILPLFGRNLEPVSSLGSYKRLQRTLSEAHDLPELFRARTRLLIIGHEAIAAHMSGPAVRVLEMGRALASVARVTIATPAAVEIEDPHVTFASFNPNDPSGLKRLAEDADVLLVQGFTLVQYPFLESMHLPVIVDLYCPFTIEHLEQTRSRLAAAADSSSSSGASNEKLAAAQQDAAGVLGVQNHQLRVGDFFLCASEAQRDFWIGALHSHGRLNPLTYGDDPTLRRLIDVVPFGLPEEPATEAAARAEAVARAEAAARPETAAGGETALDAAAPAENGRAVMKGVRPGIGPTDRVLLWAGSMLDWQDPVTLIRAVGELSRTRDDVKLLFMGTKHPNPAVSLMRVVEESRAVAQQLGLLDTHVFFNDWVPYNQRARYLVEADIGISTHRDHLETHFSFRTRMLDYIWAGLPIVCTRGDFFAGLVDERGLGATVPPGDPEALALTLARLLDDPVKRFDIRSRLETLQDELRWSIVVAPLAGYCAQPYFAADRAPAMRAFRDRLELQYRGPKWLKRTALRLGLSEYRIERLKQSTVGRAAMAAQTRLALRRARRTR